MCRKKKKTASRRKRRRYECQRKKKMSTYVKQSSCGSSLIGTDRGDILIRGAPLYPRISIPVSDQWQINQWCQDKDNSQFPGGNCGDFQRNHNLFMFLQKNRQNFSDSQLTTVIPQLGVCESEGLRPYLQWQQDQIQTKKDGTSAATTLSAIARTCGIGPAPTP